MNRQKIHSRTSDKISNKHYLKKRTKGLVSLIEGIVEVPPSV
jgi:hypothetical protein